MSGRCQSNGDDHLSNLIFDLNPHFVEKTGSQAFDVGVWKRIRFAFVAVRLSWYVPGGHSTLFSWGFGLTIPKRLRVNFDQVFGFLISVMFNLQRYFEIVYFRVICSFASSRNKPMHNRPFRVAVPVAWNSLPLDIRLAPTLSTFKNMLKTHLLSRSYFTD